MPSRSIPLKVSCGSAPTSWRSTTSRRRRYYEYAGQQYRLQYLGGLLHSEHQPKLQGQALPLPVILVRGAEQPMALQVDSLMGTREIVVKSLGPQFSSVRGVSGATILGDGNVVVILDLPAMIRSDILSQRQRLMLHQMGTDAASQRESDRPLVMVVDDSVTVRKVTSRLLERNGMDVVTAKDGLDAVAQLQDHQPDVILLDIEMPRMDGFEVASFVRHDERLREMPICMITSRTGQKHRDRAMAIGVNEYLGKPFQETELLQYHRTAGRERLMAGAPTVAIISDQRVAAASLAAGGGQVRSAGPLYRRPRTLHGPQPTCPTADLWIVALEDENDSPDLLDHLLETTEARILFGLGQAPDPGRPDYARWERRLFSKLRDQLGELEVLDGASSLAALEQRR